MALIHERARPRGTAVPFITHDPAMVDQFCDRVYVMHAGRRAPTAGIVRYDGDRKRTQG